jgi:hypothetical protein
MKQLVMVLLTITLLFGCSGLSIDPGNDLATRILVKIAVREIACEIKISGDTELNRTLVNLYETAKTGELSPDALAQLSELVVDRPTLALAVADLIALLGIQIDQDSGIVTGLSNISPEMYKAIEDGYSQGYSVCQTEVK